MSVLSVNWKDMDFGQAFNRGSSMRELGLPVDAVILESEDKSEWLKGWAYQNERTPDAPVIWKLAL